MHGLSRHTVVEHIARQVNERRQHSLELRYAYAKLALAILADDDVEPPADSTPPLRSTTAA